MAELAEGASKFATEARNKLARTPPREWAVSGGVALVACLVFGALFGEKGQSSVNFYTIAFSAALAAVSVLVRGRAPEDQYAWSVVFMSVVALVTAARSYAAPLLLGLAPPVINRAVELLR
jgi:hypothetical protein